MQSRLTTAAHRESQQFFKSLESQVEISGNQNFEVLVIKFEVLWYCQKLFVDCRNIRVTELTAEVDNSLRRGKKSSHFFLTFPRKNPGIYKNFSGLFDIERGLNEFEIFDSEIERWEKNER